MARGPGRLVPGLTLATVLLALPVGAQVGPAGLGAGGGSGFAPPGINPAAIVPQGSPLPGITPPAPAILRPSPPAPGPVTPARGGKAVLAIATVGVDGQTAYAADELALLTPELTGPAIPQDRIEAARAAILNRYRADGYVYTVVDAVITPGPAGGRLRFVITEGHIADVRLDGDIGPAGTQVLRLLDNLKRVRPIDVNTLERWLLLASDVPGVTIRSVLNPSEQEAGALTLIAQVSRKPFGGLATADNRGFRQTGPEQFLASLNANSFTSLGEQTQLSFYRTFNSTNIFGQASVEAFAGGSGLKIRLYGGAGDATPSGDLRAIGYDGATRVFGAQASYPVIRRRQQSLYLLGILDAVESDITLGAIGPDARSGRASFDSLRILRAGADYALLDTLAGADRGGANVVTLRVSQGLTAFGASRNGSRDAPRTGEKVDFTKVSAEVGRTQTLFTPWAGASVALKGTLAGQYSGDILPPAEKAYLGGPRLNRGFYYGEITGDSAVTGSVELQLTTGIAVPALLDILHGDDVAAQFYAFYDQGETFENQATDKGRRLSSWGGGVRISATRFVDIDLEAVQRLTRRPLGGLATRPLHGLGLYWQVVGRF